jgi:hypothetical protein
MKKIICIIIIVLLVFSSSNKTQQDTYIDLGTRRLTSYSTTEINQGAYKIEHRISIVFNYTALDFPYEGLNTHIEVNTLLLEDLIITFDYELVTISTLSPIIILRVNAFTNEILNELNRIALEGSVKVLFKYTEETPMQTFSSGFEFEGDTGDGGSGGSNPPDPEREVVKVGIVDEWLPMEETNCEYIHSTDHFYFRREIGHEGAVAYILIDNFDDVQYLEVCYSSYRESGNSFINAIDGLLNLNVDIIVIAIGYLYNIYDENTYHIDYVTWHSGVTIVSSSGNRGLEENGGDYLIAHSAISYNGISVGGIEEDNSFWEGSSYIYEESDIIYEESDINKPNIVDFVEFPNDEGTSFSAPRAAAKIAMFLSYYPEYKRDHIAILSFIHASALKSHINVQGDISHQSGLTNKLGAGIIDLDLLYDIAKHSDYHRIIPIENPTSLPLDLYSFSVYIPLDYKVQISLSSFYRNCDSAGFNNRTEGITQYDIILLNNQNHELKSVVSQSNILHLTYHNDIAYGWFTVIIRQKTASFCHSADSEIVVSYTTVPA